MTRISFLYPRLVASRFDMDYYLQTHMPWSIGLLKTSKGFKEVCVEKGVSGGAPGSDPTYVAVCHFLFDSIDDFLAAVAPHMAELQADFKNYTDTEPSVQVSEVLMHLPA